ncbi:MAG TPA: hypothetical protein VMV59_09910, partial [Candidatus Dormibacteraeota bacterium]|nr:hypothetical protein [Candidatus Dormibacteraeota bacterium]
MTRIQIAMALFLLTSASLLPAPRLAAEPAAKKLPVHCDSACLTNVMNAYVAALLAHDPSQVPLAPHVEFVENTKVLHPGEGL